MGKGILSGLIWGTVVGGLLVAVLSLYAPVTPAPIAAVTEEAETAETAEALEGTAPTEVGTTTQAKEAETATAEGVPTTQAEEATSAAAGQVSPVTAETAEAATEAGSTARADSADKAAEVQSEELASVAPEGVAPTTESGAEQASTPDTQVADTPDVETSIAATLEAPAITGVELPTVSTATSPSETEVTGEPKRLKVPEITDEVPEQLAEPTILRPSAPESEETETASASTPIAVPAPEADNPVGNVVVNRLPTVSAPAPPVEGDETDAEVDAEADGAAEEPEATAAIDRFSAEVEVPDGAALFAIVLIDAGENGIPRDKLLALDMPVTIALDPIRADARAAMEAYRAAGIEVVAMPEDLPTAASPSDVRVAMTGYFGILEEAVGVLDPLDGRIQSNRSLLQPVLGAIRETGHGLLTYDRGLNSAQQAARRESIPTATIYRLLDGDLEGSPLIKRYLDRAAFTANQDGSVVVVGRSYPDTVTALVEWGLERKDGDLAIVPVSAIMKAGAE